MNRSNFCAAVAFATLVVPLQAESQTTLYDTVPEPFAWTENEIRPESPDETMAQGFTTGPDGAIWSVSLPLARVGSPSGQLSFQIWDDNGGHPGSKVATMGSVDLTTLKTTSEGGSVLTFRNPLTGLIPNSTYYFYLDATDAIIPNWENSVQLNTTAASTGTTGAPRLQLKVPGDWAVASDLLGENWLNYLVMSVEKPQRSSIAFEQARFDRGYETIGGLESSAENDSDDLVHWQSFDNWSVPRAEKVTGFRWQGVFMGGDYDPVNGRWELSIWSDNGDIDNARPDTELFREVVSATEVPATEGGTIDGLAVKNFAFNLSDSFMADADTKYWISAVYIGDSRFAWTFGASGPAPLKQHSWASVIFPADGFISLQRSATTATGGEVFFRWANSAMTILSVPANDSDLDGLDDVWEMENQLDTTIDDAFADPDSDGSTHLEEYAQKSDPQLADTDGDGLLDGVESNTGEYVDATNTGTSPIFADTDHDGLIDSVETNTGVFVDAAQPGTDPNEIDSDFDGYGDLLEIRQGLSPLNSEEFPGLVIRGVGTNALEGNDLTDRLSEGSATIRSFRNPNLMFVDHPAALFDNLLAGKSTYWVTQINDGTGEFPFLYIEITFEEAIILDHFNFGAPTNLNFSPTAWAIEGSNDGEIFDTIFHRTDANQRVWTKSREVASFEAGVHFQTPQAYKSFRLTIHPDPSIEFAADIQLGELELFGAPDSLRIDSVVPLANENGVEIRWNSLSTVDVRYHIQRSFDLGVWETIASDLPSEGTSTSFIDSDFEALPNRVFYRVSDDE